MDPDSPVSRMERNFWTVWCYITGAVNRFFRPEPANIVSNDPDSLQESAVDTEPANCAHAEGDTSGNGVDEELPLAPASLLSSSQPVVAWQLCTTDIDLGPDEESMQYKTQLSRGSESKASEEGEGTREEQFSQTGNDDAGLLVAKDARAKEDKQGENGDQKLDSRGQDEAPENNDEYEAHVNTRSLGLTGDTERAMTADDTVAKVQVNDENYKMHREDDQDVEAEDIQVKLCTNADLSLEEEDNMHVKEARVQRDKPDTATHEEVERRDGVLQLASKTENKSDEGEEEVENRFSECKELPDDDRDFREDLGFTSLHVELQMAFDKSGIVSEDGVTVAGQERAMARRSDKAEGAKDKEDEREQGAVTEEGNVNKAANNQRMDEVPEQEDNINMVTGDSQEEDILTLYVTCREEVVQNAKAEMHRAESTDGEQEDVAKDTEVQAKTIETDDVETESHGTVIEEKSGVTVGGRPFDKDQVEEGRLSSEEGDKEGYMEIACTTTSVTVKPEGETGQEISGGFKNISLGVCEGRVVESQEQKSPACEETQEGVPEYNNEPWPDENTTQRFLEVGDSKQIQTTQLPEEVESQESENLQNSVRSTGADYLKVRERMEEEQESTEVIKNSFDLVNAELPQETEKPLVEAVTQESGHLLVKEEGKLLVDSMKTGIEHSQKEFECDVSLTDKTDERTEELQDGTEELLAEFEIDEGLCDSKKADAAGDGRETTGAVTSEEVVADEMMIKFLESEVQKMTETSFFRESVDAINSEQNITDVVFPKQADETEPILLEDGTVEMQDAGISMEETGYGVEEEAAEDEMQNRNEMEILNLRAAEQTTGRKEKENTLIAKLSTADELMTTECKPKELTGDTEETVISISGSQDVIDEEILDLWMQDTEKQQEGPEPGPQMDAEIESSNEEQEEISSVQTEKDKEQLVESNSGESELVSDTEVSSSTAESGFLDQSLGEWGTQNSETQLLKSFQGVHDMLANVLESADELSTQLDSGSQELSMAETAETGQSHLEEKDPVTETGFRPDSVEAGRLNQESDRSQEEKTDKGSQKEITDVARETEWKDAEEEDVKSATEMSALFEAGKIKIGDEPLEMTASDSPDEIQHAESARSRRGSEASLEEGNVSTESGSQGAACTESEKRLLKLPSLDKPQPRWSEDIADSLPALNRAEVAEQPTTKSEDRFEVDASALDFTMQKSRIAAKNPRVRPPKDPRSLLHMPSVDPTPASLPPVTVPAGVPLGGLGIGIKLPGLGAGFPVLKKTQRVVRDESSPGTLLQEPETKPEKSDTPKQDEAQHKPKWMPPRHPGFGNPLMSELKTKLKKTTKD